MSMSDLTADWVGRDAESLIWLASYPRSGNTFARILLANYLASSEEAFDLNQLQDFIPSDVSTAVWGSPRSAAEDWESLWKARPGAIARYRETKEPQIVPCLKTHTANVMAFGSYGFDLRPNDRIVYIVRHPLDVLISFADFNGQDINSAIELMTQSGLAIRTAVTGSIELRGAWAEHVTSWISRPACPMLLIRYEDLCAKTEAILGSILDFLGIPIVEGRLGHAASISSFEKVRVQETAIGFIERPAETNSRRFFREGKSFQWQHGLAPDQAFRLADACEEIMVPLGYTHPRDVGPDGHNILGPIRLEGLMPDIND